MKEKTWKSPAFIIAAGLLWGHMGLFVRFLSGYGFTSAQTSALRIVTGTIMLIIFVLIKDKSLFKVELKALPIFAAMGIFSVLIMCLLYSMAIVRISLSAAAILLYTSPIWVLAASVVFYGERLTPAKLTALFLVLAGCVLVSGVTGTSLSFSGILCGLGSGLAYALYSIIGKPALSKYRPLTVTVYSFIFASAGALIMLCTDKNAAAFNAQTICADLIIKVLGFGFVTVFAPYLLYTVGLSQTPAGKAAIMVSVEPMAATVVGCVIFRESLSFSSISGIILILAAIVLLNVKASSAG